MTDERMDARLHDAGARWREAHDRAAHIADEDEVPLQRTADGRRPARRTTTLLSVAALAVVAVAGTWLALRPGSSSQSVAAARLTSTDWILAGYNGTTVRYDSADRFRLTIKDGQILGNDGCNAFSGPVDVSGHTLRLHGLAGTLAGCTAAAHSLPLQNYFSGTVHWSVTGDTLTLTKDGVGTLTYRAPLRGSREDLVDRTWVLRGIRNPTGDVGWYGSAPAPPTTAATFQPVTDSTLFISARGVLSADTRCGQYSARVDITAKQLTVSSRSYAVHSCPQPARGTEYAQDAATLALRTVLHGTLRWSIDGGTLTLGAEKGPVLQYGPEINTPVPSATPTAVPSATASPLPSVSATASPVVAALLVDRTWYLAGIDERAMSTSGYSSSPAIGVDGTPPPFRMGSDGAFIAGLGTCEAYQGRAHLADRSFTITSRRTAAGLCPAEPRARPGASGRLPTLIGQVLTGTVRWHVSGDALSLSHPGSHVVLRYSDVRPSPTVTPRS